MSFIEILIIFKILKSIISAQVFRDAEEENL